ncbi:MAG: holo-ACP synthase [Streptococcaceae bacterium]|nr:holo-ACP synthase [Streptococcaceae bacterium]
MIAKEKFVTRVLTPNEQLVFSKLAKRRRIEYLAGRWTAKEAFSKAWGTGIGKLGFQDIEVLNNQYGKPYFAKLPPFDGTASLSLSHSETTVVAFVIIQRTTDK